MTAPVKNVALAPVRVVLEPSDVLLPGEAEPKPTPDGRDSIGTALVALYGTAGGMVARELGYGWQGQAIGAVIGAMCGVFVDAVIQQKGKTS